MRPDQDPILNYEDEQRIRALLAAEVHTDGLRTPDRVEHALRSELRRRNRAGLTVRLLGAGAIAAATLLGLFLLRPPAAEEHHAAAHAPTSTPPPAVVAQRAPVPPPVPRPAVRRPRPRPVAPPPAPASEFIPVGTWQALEPMERGAIVRVRMPKSALPAMGIAVSGDRWNEFIPADVVLGEDGTLRAVRFINARQ